MRKQILARCCRKSHHSALSDQRPREGEPEQIREDDHFERSQRRQEVSHEVPDIIFSLYAVRTTGTRDTIRAQIHAVWFIRNAYKKHSLMVGYPEVPIFQI